jgi:hypothetical protein
MPDQIFFTQSFPHNVDKLPKMLVFNAMIFFHTKDLCGKPNVENFTFYNQFAKTGHGQGG